MPGLFVKGLAPQWGNYNKRISYVSRNPCAIAGLGVLCFGQEFSLIENEDRAQPPWQSVDQPPLW
ncbi:hypothetical protein Lepto7375DRAFT_7405 [Leptolyngbya sp. PCC 7375]|nr:hypothetical protein Lepto7375DRAFT_7405 [Leptolyngbya sp. PCC 7375]